MVRERILEILNNRHACKIMDPTKKISKEDFDLILEAGRLSPSSFGFEPWKFLVVQNQDLRNEMLPFTWGAQNTLVQASHFVIVLARKEVHMKPGSPYLDYMMREVHKLPEDVIEIRSAKYKGYHENEAKLNTPEKVFDWSSKQTYIPLGIMMNVAMALGVDSCPIEGFDYDSANKFVAEKLGVNLNEFGVSHMIAFGYRVNEPRPKTRKAISELVEWF